AAEFLTSINDTWHTTNGAGAAGDWERAADRTDAVAGTHYLPSEIQRVTQKDMNAYAMLNFETPDPDGLRLAGNVGVRLVRTKMTSSGTTRVPTQGDLGITNPFFSVLDPTDPTIIITQGRCESRVPPGSPPGTPAVSPGGVCDLGLAGYEQLQQWAGA